MTYTAELQFFKKVLDQMNLPYLTAQTASEIMPMADFGLRSALGMEDRVKELWQNRANIKLQSNVIYYITDEFFCRYVVLLLPEQEQETVMIIGPYVLDQIDRDWIAGFLEESQLDSRWQPVFEQYFRRTCYLETESFLTATLQALGEQIWGPLQFTTERVVRGLPETWRPLTNPEEKTKENILDGVQMIERSYEAENRMIEVISQGRVQKAQLMLSRFTKAALEQRTEPTRDVKNYSIILNTLMRKAAERGGVHPMYIDRVSSLFARRIETTARWEDFMELWNEMARGYCLLVKKHALAEYSALVQKVLTLVDFDLAADLSLRAIAGSLNVNASYLSTRFKQETGITLTEYVNQKRMEHAAYLLQTTHMPIYAVAQNCGIQDENYFVKIFKRYTQKTPRQFRQERSTIQIK